jgi:hypothetical protein
MFRIVGLLSDLNVRPPEYEAECKPSTVIVHVMVVVVVISVPLYESSASFPLGYQFLISIIN